MAGGSGGALRGQFPGCSALPKSRPALSSEPTGVVVARRTRAEQEASSQHLSRALRPWKRPCSRPARRLALPGAPRSGHPAALSTQPPRCTGRTHAALEGGRGLWRAQPVGSWGRGPEWSGPGSCAPEPTGLAQGWEQVCWLLGWGGVRRVGQGPPPGSPGHGAREGPHVPQGAGPQDGPGLGWEPAEGPALKAGGGEAPGSGSSQACDPSSPCSLAAFAGALQASPPRWAPGRALSGCPLFRATAGLPETWPPGRMEAPVGPAHRPWKAVFWDFLTPQARGMGALAQKR